MRIKPIIIGMLFPLALLMAAPPAHALYSPHISTIVEVIKSHVADARQKHAVGSARQGTEKGLKLFDEDTVKKINEDNRRRRAEDAVPGGFPSKFHQLRAELKSEIALDALSSYGETFALIFNYLPEQNYVEDGEAKKNDGRSISSCLRDDIFELELFRDATLNQALRSALQFEAADADILWEDYQTLRSVLKLLKTQYSRQKKLFFPDGMLNYYEKAHCPAGGFFGEYELAAEEFMRAWNTLMTLGSSSNVDWGSITEISSSDVAKARKRAKEWITKNKLNLTLGGETGGSAESALNFQDLKDTYNLFSKEGFGGVGSKLLDKINIIKSEIDFVALAFPPTKCDKDYAACIAKENADEAACDAEKTACEAAADRKVSLDIIGDRLEKINRTRTAFLSRAETALTFSLQFDSVTEKSTAAIDRELFLLNNALEASHSDAIINACTEVQALLSGHCKNKPLEIPACK